MTPVFIDSSSVSSLMTTLEHVIVEVTLFTTRRLVVSIK